MSIDVTDLFAWLFALFRATALMLSMPVFSHTGFPRKARVGLAALLALIVTPEAAAVLTLPSSALALGLIVAKEIAIGVLMGMAVRIVFATLDFAAHVLAVEIGLHPPPQFDSASNISGNPIGTGLFYLGVVVFFSGAHYAMMVAFTRSFELVPPGWQHPASGFVPEVVQHTARIIGLGVLMSAPFIAVNFLINLIFAMLGRVVPRMNVFILSFSVRIFAGLSMLAVSAGLLVHYMIQEFRDLPEVMLRFLPFAIH